MDNSYLTYRCKNTAAHDHGGRHTDGNIIALIGKNQILVRCNDLKCRAWVSLKLDFPGINIDLRNAGVTQSIIQKPGINGQPHFNTSRAPVIIEEE